MSMFTLYMLLKLDAIRGFFVGAFLISGVVLFFVILEYCIFVVELKELQKKHLKKLIKISLSIFIISSIVIPIMPSTKEMAFIYVASKISNTEKGKNIGENMLNIPDNALEIVNIKMKEYLEDIKKETIKEVTK